MRTKNESPVTRSCTRRLQSIFLSAAAIILAAAAVLRGGEPSPPRIGKIISHHWATHVLHGSPQSDMLSFIGRASDSSFRVLVLKIQVHVPTGGSKFSAYNSLLWIEYWNGDKFVESCKGLAMADSPDPGVFGTFLFCESSAKEIALSGAGKDTAIPLPQGKHYVGLAYLLEPDVKSVKFIQKESFTGGASYPISRERPYSICITGAEDRALLAQLTGALKERGYQVIVSHKEPPEAPAGVLGINTPGVTVLIKGVPAKNVTVFYSPELEDQAQEISEQFSRPGFTLTRVKSMTAASPFDIHIHIAK